MAKGKKQKKKNMKLRRQLRKTLGCLFMVSALLVTAIPVQPMEAADTTGWSTGSTGYPYCGSKSETIPNITSDTPIYQTEDGNYRFAYVDSKGNWSTGSEQNKFAVIVGYEKAQPVKNGLLVIPDVADAYVKYTDTLGSTGGYAAANKKGYPLYYKVTKQEDVTETTSDVMTYPDGHTEPVVVTKKVTKFVEFSPCTSANKSQWNDGIADATLYYYNAIGTDGKITGIPPADALKKDETADTNWKAVSGDEDGRIRDASVKYIGNQYAVYDNSQKKWVVTDTSTSNANESVFGGTGEGMTASNVVSLQIGDNLSGIGDYAFYGCTNLQAFTPSNGFNTLGNYAFANCINLKTVNMAYYTNLSTLGHHAFSNCGMLDTFVLPTAVQSIGDFCFENCTKLKTVDMTGATTSEEHNYSLNKIGHKAFINCTSLTSLTLPSLYHGGCVDDKDDFHLSTVQGCKNLKFISTQSQKLNFVTDQGTEDNSGKIDGSYSFDEFKADVGDEFYFEAPGYMDGTNNKTKTPVHNTANVEQIAFKYYGEDKYEIVKPSVDIDGKAVGLVYAVNSGGNLIVFRVEVTNETGQAVTAKVQVPEITMPEKIGPYGIRHIVEGSFSDNCWVQKVTIPASVETIGDNSFKGCHNLNHVIFTNPENITSIGSNAFATQKIRTDSPSHADGGLDGNSCKETDEKLFAADNKPFLSFSGAIEKSDGSNTEPFKYAMKAGSNINEGRQPLTYITYYSGIPTNLTVMYNPATGLSELQDFPTKSEVEEGFVVKTTGGSGEGGGTESGGSGGTESDGSGGTESGEGGTGTATKTTYKYPYITDAISTEAAGAFGGGTLTENQANLKNAVENIVIPNGVNSIKEGLFSGLNSSGVQPSTITTESPNGALPADDYVSASAADIHTITSKSVADIKPYTFARMDALTSAYISGAANVGNYAFDNCKNLASAEIGADTATLGLRPFSGCTKLTNVTFPNSTAFSYDNGIIYGLKDGAKNSIVECLESRGTLVGSRVAGPDEFTGVKSISKEAFMDCDELRTVDLSKSSVTDIPELCFAESDKLSTVILPNTIISIKKGSFWNTKMLGSVTIPDSIVQIAPDAFAYVDKDKSGVYGDPKKDRDGFDFVTLPTSYAALYREDYPYIGITQDDSLKGSWSVMIFDAVDESNPKLVDDRTVVDGENLILTDSDAPDHTADGYQFSRWWPSADIFNPIVDNTEIWAMYTPIGATTYTVRFFDINKAEMKDYTQQVVSGKDAAAPPASAMEVEGKVFTGWDRALTNVTASFDTYAQYSDREPGTYVVRFWADDAMTQMIGKAQIVKEGEAAIEPAHPTKEGYTFTGWFPSSGWEKVTKDLDVIALYKEGTGTDTPGGDTPGGDNPGGNNGNNGNNGGSGSDSSNSNNSVSDNSTKYKVVVNGGSGSGEYTAGTIVPINAYARADDTVFDKWTSSSSGVGFVNQTAISTTFTMPSNNVEITANYKKGSGSSSVSSNSRSARRNSTTTVDVTKGGISNTGLASANVNGSSDNYVVKITEDAQATAAVIAALEAKYGDLSNIAYMPMDISLYDSTGQTKITDVSGVTVDITLPLPDDLIQYAGNNKAAGVVNGQLDELGAKFTTIDGVPCIQFTATHFSPYTIYVDKANLTEGTVDSTPKTGDPIHPKWFLAMGLACIAIILFCKKDKGQPKVKTA